MTRILKAFARSGRGTDAPEADDAHRAPREARHGADAVPVPRREAVTQAALGADDAAIAREHEADGVVGDLVGAVVRHIADGDAPRGGGADVHGVVAHAAADDDAAGVQFRDEVGGHGDFVEDDDRGGLAQAAVEFGIAVRLEAADLREAGEFALFEIGRGREVIGDDDLVHRAGLGSYGVLWCACQTRRRPSRVREGSTAVISGSFAAMSFA